MLRSVMQKLVLVPSRDDVTRLGQHGKPPLMHVPWEPCGLHVSLSRHWSCNDKASTVEYEELLQDCATNAAAWPVQATLPPMNLSHVLFQT
jgi:hypothetical protein